MKKSPAITDATRQGFVDAFLTLRRSKPINKITVREIVEITGNNRTTFYRYFEDVYALYDYVQELLFNQISPLLLNNLVHNPNEAELTASIRYILDTWQDYFEVILSDSIAFGLPDRLRQLETEFLIRELHLPGDNPKTRYLIECYLAVVLSVFKGWASDRERLPVEDLTLMLHDILSEGIFPQLRTLSPILS